MKLHNLSNAYRNRTSQSHILCLAIGRPLNRVGSAGSWRYESLGLKNSAQRASFNLYCSVSILSMPSFGSTLIVLKLDIRTNPGAAPFGFERNFRCA